MSVRTHLPAEISKTVYGPGGETQDRTEEGRGFWEQGWFMGTTHGVTQGPILRKVLGLASGSSCHCLKILNYF